MSEKISDIKVKIVETALELAEEQGWANTTLRDISEKSGISLSEIYTYAGHKDDILTLLGGIIDQKVLETVSISEQYVTSKRDRIFDILMDRYDILNDYRSGVIAILDSFMCDPKQAVISLPHICRSMNWMLEAVGIETSGIRGAIKVTGLAAIYVKVLIRVWKSDESKDMSKTMAALDKSLDKVEGIVNRFGL